MLLQSQMQPISMALTCTRGLAGDAGTSEGKRQLLRGSEQVWASHLKALSPCTVQSHSVVQLLRIVLEMLAEFILPVSDSNIHQPRGHRNVGTGRLHPSLADPDFRNSEEQPSSPGRVPTLWMMAVAQRDIGSCDKHNMPIASISCQRIWDKIVRQVM